MNIKYPIGGKPDNTSFTFKQPWFKHGYTLFPYFGGTKPASKDMSIEINEL